MRDCLSIADQCLSFCGGAVTADGIKRRVGCGMGRCQGSRCAFEIDRILKECGYGGTD